MLRSAALVLVLLLLTACGGNGGNDAAPSDTPTPDPSSPSEAPPPDESPPDDPAPPEDAPFGLSEREALAPLDLPQHVAALGRYELVQRFPDLSFSGAIFLTGIPGDSRLAVVEQAGRIRAFDDDPNVSTARTVLDLSGRILFDGEQGLLGLAFDPEFASNRYLYVHYSMDNPRRSVIARFTWDEDTDRVDEASRKILLTLEQPYANHNGGMLAFGPDGDLYIAFGDGGSANDPQNRAQDLGNFFGSLLRIDVHPSDPSLAYAIPPDNPHVGEAGAKPAIWAHGLRNPFRFSFDRDTGTLWLGDVGQSSEEEIDIITRGNNYGWRVWEGNTAHIPDGNSLPRSAFTFPIHTYDNTGGAAIIGGYVYRGSGVPTLRGRYLYSDFITGAVRALTYDAASQTVTDDTRIATAPSPTSFGEDNDGEVYLVTQDSGIFGFEDTSGNAAAPRLLSETGLFTDLDSLTPAAGLIEYQVNLPFWSDGAQKRRWIGIPDGETIGFSRTGAWQFPAGTVLVKHFELPLVDGDPSSVRRLETRVFTNQGGSWHGFTYRWNTEQSDAELVTAGTSEVVTVQTSSGERQQRYDYPGPNDCLRCHTAAADHVLGVNTRQLNRDVLYPASNVTDNQLRALNHIGLFTNDIGDPAGYEQLPDLADNGRPLDQRARGYLAVNCSQCHQPGGPTPVNLDLRFDTGDADMHAIGVAPQEGNLGVSDARIIAAGDHTRSVLWLRMQHQDDQRMPPLSSHVVDQTALDVIGEWIDSL